MSLKFKMKGKDHLEKLSVLKKVLKWILQKERLGADDWKEMGQQKFVVNTAIKLVRTKV